MTRKKVKAAKGRKESPALAAKKAKVDSLAKLSSKYPVVALVSLRNLPDRILQSSKKKLRGKAEFMVAKTSTIKRALEKAKKSGLSEHIDFPTSLVFADMTPYSLFRFFKENKVKVAAKPGQIAPFDIVVHEGETDLLPGPALSELKAAGINAQIKAGKIIVAKDSVVAKEGAKINDGVCKALQKLNILPFEAMVDMVAAFDGNFTYTSSMLDIDDAKLRAGLLECLAQSFSVSFNSSFPTPQNIEALLSGAFSQGRNVAINGMVYSDASTELLLANAFMLGETLSGKIGNLESSAPAPSDAAKGQASAEAKPGVSGEGAQQNAGQPSGEKPEESAPAENEAAEPSGQKPEEAPAGKN